MLNWLQRGLVLLARFIALWRIMGLASAFRGFILARRSTRLIRVPVRQLGRVLHLRSRADFWMLKHFYDPNYRITDLPDNRVATIIDAGANIGVETLRFRHNHPDARIISIEPDAGNFNVLRQNCLDDPKIETVNVALWSDPTTLTLLEGHGNEAFHVTAGGGDGRQVEAISIEDILAKTGWPRISILKLDIEGAEHELFGTGADRWVDRAGTAQTLFKALDGQDFNAEILGENIVLIRPETGWCLEPQIDYRRPS